jgi:nitroreductase
VEALLALAAAAPDHGHLLPWRFVIVPNSKRELLAEAFAVDLLERDAQATAVQVEDVREKACRSPFLMIAIARLAEPGDRIPTAERLVSLGAALQNVLLGAEALGYGAGLTSGQAISSGAIRSLLGLGPDELAVCFLSIGTSGPLKAQRSRPEIQSYATTL